MENQKIQFSLTVYGGSVSINENNILVFGGSNKNNEYTDQTFICNTVNNYIQISALNTVNSFHIISRFHYRQNA